MSTDKPIDYDAHWRKRWAGALFFGSTVVCAIIGIMLIILLLDQKGEDALAKEGKKIRSETAATLGEIKKIADEAHKTTRGIVVAHDQFERKLIVELFAKIDHLQKTTDQLSKNVDKINRTLSMKKE